MSIATSFGDKIKYRTWESQFNLEDFLNKYGPTLVESEKVFFLNVSIKGDPIYYFGEFPREIEAIIDYSSIERVSVDTYEFKGDKKSCTLRFLVDSKQGLFFKQYLLKKLE